MIVFVVVVVVVVVVFKLKLPAIVSSFTKLTTSSIATSNTANCEYMGECASLTWLTDRNSSLL